MKYTDGQYHVEYHEHKGIKDGYAYWTVVNVYGEVCFNENRNYIFGDERQAQRECDQLNQCAEGAIFADLT